MNWNQRFSTKGYLYGTEPSQALVKLEKYLIKNGDTLNIADGEGRNSVYLAKKGFQVTATDYSKVAVNKAKALAKKHDVNVNYKLENFFNINWSEKKYDNVIGIFFQFIPSNKIKSAFLQIRKSVKKNGILLIHGYTPKQVKFGTGGPKNAEQMYTKKTFEDTFNDVQILVNNEYQLNISEGLGHKGKSALIDFVARC